ncbi:RDD family protein [Longibacter sp.]|uniref:RDD family protein n=1 Tax=Longibacter sp. TaxID=2045415 RepID=UPI003EB9D829
MQNVDVQTAQNVSLSVELAGVGSRFFASIIDYATLAAYLITAAPIAGFLFGMSASVQVLVAFPALVYFLAAEALYDGQTVGKHVMGIRVRNLDGTAPSPGAYVIRWLLRPFDILMTTGFVGFVSIVVTQHGQRLGDLAAGTTVVRQRKETEIRDLAYLETPEDHEVTYPQVAVLTDSDIQIARDVLNTLVEEGRSLHTKTLGSRTQEVLAHVMNVQPSESPMDFLRTIVEDYNDVHGGGAAM